MKTDAGKRLLVCLCLLVASCSCFRERVRTLTDRVNGLFGKTPSENEHRDDVAADDDAAAAAPQWKRPDGDGPTAQQCRRGDGTPGLWWFGVDWTSVSSKVSNNWWIIAVSSLMPFVLFWRVRCNTKKRMLGWRRLFAGREETQAPHTRRPTLPDLTLARHARRESLAEAAHKSTGHPRNLSQCKASQFRSTRNSSFERNDDSPGDAKRVHYIIRRRH